MIVSLESFLSNQQNARTHFPPKRERRININKANIVPPTSAASPKIVLAARKIPIVDIARVNKFASSPFGGKHFFNTGMFCSFSLIVHFSPSKLPLSDRSLKLSYDWNLFMLS